MTETFSIKTEIFEGPLELLLELIEKRKLLINDISLAAVTDEYMAHVANLEEGRMRNTAQFVLIAATLLLIKSRSLLPVLSLTDEEEASIDDLERRLRLYQIYARAGVALKRSFGTRSLYARPFKASEVPLFKPDRYVAVPGLHLAMRTVLTELPKTQKPRVHVAIRKVISLEDMMTRLERRITDQLKISFRHFAGDTAEGGSVIVSFLAVLELVKQGIVMVRQERRFADFDIERERVDVPRYT